MFRLQVSRGIWAVDRAEIGAGLHCAWFGSKTLMDHQMDDLRGDILVGG